MADFLEQLKIRLAEAQKRHQIATFRLQAAQQEHAAATQDFSSWQNAVRIETVREQQVQAQQQNPQQPQHPAGFVGPPAPTAPPAPALPTAVPSQGTTEPPANREELNKTDAIRRILHEHPEGLRPTEMWKQLGAHLKHRAYLYSVLKRLRTKGEVYDRRGKYFLKVIQRMETEEKTTHSTVQ